MTRYFKLFRIKQWVKNIIVFFPCFFSKQITAQIVITSMLAFVSFSLLASTIYMINDIMDIESDRRHPTKRMRPIASGEVSIKTACVLCAFSLLVAVLCLVASKPAYLVAALSVFCGYFLMNIFYSKRAKHIPLLDVTILAMGFLLRLFYGSLTCGIEISIWLYLVILSGSFYLGLGKRRNELRMVEKESDTRAVLKYYTDQFLDRNMYMCLTITVVFYSLWCADYGKNSDALLLTVPLLLIITMRYNLILEGAASEGNPTDVILGDRVLLGLILLFGTGLFAILYFL